jgi:hypothetical protein
MSQWWVRRSPLSECEIGGDDDGRALVESADEVEQELAAGLGERTVAKFVKDDEVHPGQMLGTLRTVFRDTFLGHVRSP